MMGRIIAMLKVVTFLCFLNHVLAQNLEEFNISLSMPGVKAPQEDYYSCASFELSHLLQGHEVGHLTEYMPRADGDKAHHMLLYTCNNPIKADGSAYSCMGMVCQDSASVIFGWAKNADETKMPDGVSLSLDPSQTAYLVLQVHYAVPQSDPDNTGLDLRVRTKSTRYDAGIFLLGVGYLTIPANTALTNGDVNCKFSTRIHPFAVRTHAHTLSYVIRGYHYSVKTNTITEFASENPMWPQAFYPVKKNVTIEPGDFIHARCSYDSSHKNVSTSIGPAHNDEMCNLYVMFYVESGSAVSDSCWGLQNPSLVSLLPKNSTDRLPSNPELEGQALNGNHHQPDNKESGEKVFQMRMPGAEPKEDDSYICTALDVKEGGILPLYGKGFKVSAKAGRVHHLIVQVCSAPAGDGMWDCRHHSVCLGAGKIIFAWAKEAPNPEIPDDVGFLLNEKYRYLVLQIHYKHPLPDKDYSGIDIYYSAMKPKYHGGIYIFLRNQADLTPGLTNIQVDMSCGINHLQSELKIFAFRTHTHSLGKVIYGYRVRDNNYTLIAAKDPQKPQAFYPTDKEYEVKNGDIITARCVYGTVGNNKTVSIGSTAGDEMCNLYLMYYTEEENADFKACFENNYKEIANQMPVITRESLNGEPEKPIEYDNGHPKEGAQPKEKKQFPINGSDGSKKEGYYQMLNWPLKQSLQNIGQPSGVAIDVYGNPTVFHRGDRVWNAYTFNLDNTYAGDRNKPISADTIVTLDNQGKIIHSWGANMFFMPHMITIDHQNNVWVTDVALHVVFKFEPYGGKGGKSKPLIQLGTKFEPGNDDRHYCKPTSVAVSKDGKTFFVADGYCNSRVIKYTLQISDTGFNTVMKALSIQQPQPNRFSSVGPSSFNIPHGLALSEEKDLVFVADRENNRVQVFKATDGTFYTSLRFEDVSSTVYSVDFSTKDSTLIAISGPGYPIVGKSPKGFKVDTDKKKVLETFNIGNGGFQRPHDCKISQNGSEIYVVDLDNPVKVAKLIYGKGEVTNIAPSNNTIPENSQRPASTNGSGVLDTLEKVIPSSNVGVITAIISLSITAICTIFVLCTRCRKRGKGKKNPKKDKKLDLGDLLGRSKDGFQPLNTQEDDGETLSSESDLEDFTLPKLKA